MQDSLRWLRLYLGIAGALVFLNVGVIAQVKGMENAPAYALPLSLAFATFSVFCGLLMFLAAWQCEHLIRIRPGFIKGVILFRYVILLVERVPFALSGDYLSVSLLLVWTGMTFFMLKMTGRLAIAAKAGN